MGIPSTPGSAAMLSGVNWCFTKVSRVKVPERFFTDLARVATEFRKNPELYSSLGKRIKEAKETKDNFDKVLDKVPGKDAGGKAAELGSKYAAIANFIAALALFTAQTKLTEFTQYASQQADDRFSVDVSKVLTLLGLVSSRVNRANEKIKEFELQDQRTRDRIYGLEKEIVPTREKANDALYEVRAGREILEGKIEISRKLGNDALYEVRAGRQTIDAQVLEARKLGNDALYETRQNRSLFDNLSRQYSDLSAKINQNLGNSINTTIATLKADIQAAKATAQKAESKNTLQDTAIDSAVSTVKSLARALDAIPKITNPTAAVTPADIAELRNGLGNVNVNLSSLRQTNQIQLDVLSNQDRALATTITGLASTDKELADAINRVDKKAVVPDLTPIQKALNDRFDAFVAQNNKDLGIRDLTTKELTKSELSKEFDRKIADFTRQSNLTADQRFQEFERQNAIDLGLKTTKLEQVDTSLKSDVNSLRTDLNKVGADVTGLNTKIVEGEKVNIEANKKLDQMIPLLSGIPLLPGRVSDAIKPNLVTLPEINTEVGKALCNNFKNGCGRDALNNQANDINTANKANNNDLLNKLNAGANAGQLALLTKIDNKLGAQIVGGIGGKLVAGFKWLQIDRALNVLTMAATIHNGVMLSNDIGQTLIASINNVLQLVGLKDDKGQPFNIGEAISSSIQGLITAAVGAENYTALTVTWAKANRIYQSSVNVLNAFQGLSSAILTGLEMTAGKVGKIGNALRDAGQVLETAYSWMNPQPKFNRVTQTLENLQQGASTIQMVTQAPLDIIQATTELTSQSTELINAIKDDTKPENKGKEAPEPDKLKADKDAGKLVSVGANLTDLDLEADA